MTPSAAPASLPRVLPIIPGYKLLDRLGGGTFGEVYKAVDTRGKIVAVKILKEEGAQEYRRFRRECNVLQQERENAFVVDIFEASLESSPFFLVMEWCEFGSLRPWVTDRQSWQTVAVVLSHALQGLEGIHRAGGFHRDIKPDNLLRARNKDDISQWTVKVADFGLAGGDFPAASTATFSPMGTPVYMAPEVRFLPGIASAASDIFSLGITGIELLTGSRKVEALHAANCPEPLKWLFNQMVSENPGQRPSTAVVATILLALIAPQPSASPPTPSPAAPPPAAPRATVAHAGQPQRQNLGMRRDLPRPPGAVPAAAERPSPAAAPRPAPAAVGRVVPPAAARPEPGPQRPAQPHGFAKPSVTQQQRQAAAAAGAGMGIVGVGLLGLLAYLALGQNKDWDDNVGRYRGSDGKFRR